MSNDLCAIIEGRPEKVTGEFFLASFANLVRDLAPHVGNDDDILQRGVTAEFTEHLEIQSGGSGEPAVRDAVDVDDSGKLKSFLISIEKISPEDRKMTDADVHLRRI